VTSLVVDASVATKWFLPEVHSEDALRLLDEPYRLLAPDLLYSEVGNTLWKRVVKKEISQKQSIEIIRALETLPLVSFATKPLVAAALEVACRTGRTVYDSVYLALAAHHDCRLVTADRRFYNALRSLPLKTSLLWIGDIQ
jgi:predicted nucleic acid-binding protein